MNIYVDLIFNYTLILRRALFRYNFRIRSGPAAKKSQNFSKVSFLKSLNLLVVLVWNLNRTSFILTICLAW